MNATVRTCRRRASGAYRILLSTAALLSSAAALAATEAAPAATAAAAPASRPNFVVILIDDMSFTDVGIYGGEARTPNMDMLAQRGALFTSYHTSPLCSPSRAMLLTGIDNHRTGVATIPETLPAGQRGKKGYSMHFEEGVDTVATRLRSAGYRNYLTGKWHLGHGPGELPDSHGFDHSFTLDASGADNWEQKPYMPYYTSADWFEDGKPANLPKDFYSSKFMIDQMISYLDRDQDRGDPFFAYIAFQGLHIPVQAPRELTAHYEGVYDGGWEVLRKQRWQKAKDRGLVPADAQLPPVHENLRRWEDFSAEERAMFSKSMAVYAGMIEGMDLHLGRLVEYLKRRGQFENTIFFITADNGPEPSDPIAQTGFSTWMSQNGYERKIETLGEKGSMNFIGPEWANAVAAPTRLFKFHAAEGGLRVPLIASGPGIAAGKQISGVSFVTDITPTIYDYAGIDPAKWNGPVALTGKSMKGALSGSGQPTYGPDTPVGIEVGGNSALFKGDYKLTRITRPWGDSKWRLYHLSADPGETKDLSEAEPERYQAMLADYAKYETDMGVLKLPDDFNPHVQVKINAALKQAEKFRVTLALSTLGLVTLAVFLWRRLRRPRAAQ